MSEIGDECPRYDDECPRYDDECPRYDDECPRYDDECPNSMTTSVAEKETIEYWLPFHSAAIIASLKSMGVRKCWDHLQLLGGLRYSHLFLPNWDQSYLCLTSFIGRILPSSHLSLVRLDLCLRGDDYLYLLVTARNLLILMILKTPVLQNLVKMYPSHSPHSRVQSSRWRLNRLLVYLVPGARWIV